MKPQEFWNCEYREVLLFCEANLIKQKENFKSNIILLEAVSNKLIQADAMSNKNPKVVSLKKVFQDIFKK
jgi:hypothetical protein